MNPALEPTVEITYDGADTVTAVVTNPAGSRYLLLVDSSTFTDAATASTSPLTLTATLSGLNPGDVFDAVVLPEEGNMGIGYTIFAYGTSAQVTSEAAFRRDGRGETRACAHERRRGNHRGARAVTKKNSHISSLSGELEAL